ncbi:hypothetical protein HYH03_006931 [Edaphochlamys debaryana]|uniref:EamA domain-containing protein n=1 Tax=Edaphochlamys debaryana TaxID=47281 RepID=A0A836C0X6_9CHLO|nr:hypothetical protein HYH03_006931 [Edaphochlamys debaryana]|eukprot:KAG2494998.1 hypothetical protein HYH03_006931 [Edaphochlamys debaryana]
MAPGRTLGLVFLFVTAASWIAASFITQALVSPGSGGEGAPEVAPWLLTLICSSTFMLYLPWGLHARLKGKGKGAAAKAAASARRGSRGGAEEGEAAELDAESGAGAGKSAAGGASAAEEVAGQERAPLLPAPPSGHAAAGGGGGEGGGERAVGRGSAPVVDGAAVAPAHAAEEAEVDARQIVRAAFLVCPVWFAAQLTFVASLQYTSVTSNTVLSSCSSLFVYLGALALGQEAGSPLRLACVVAAMAGTTLVTLGDGRNGAADGPSPSPSPSPAPGNLTLLAPSSSALHLFGDGSGGGGGGTGGGSMPLLGDALTLLAAALYAVYTLIMKKMLVKDDGAVMALFFSVIGVICFAALVPAVALLAAAGSPVVTRLTGAALGLALLQGLIDYVAADYAWARAVMLLGPTATSCGLAIQIPAAGIIDAVVNGGHLAWAGSTTTLLSFLLGSVLIIGGFVGVSLEPRTLEDTWARWAGAWRARSWHRLPATEAEGTATDRLRRGLVKRAGGGWRGPKRAGAGPNEQEW